MTAYVCYFDSLGFEWIFNVTDHERKKVMAYLKGEKTVDLPIPRYAILRARANPQRFPEIWAFESDLDQEELENVAHESPQVLVDAIRKCGQNIFRLPREESVIV
jgi:hypothetical protein